MTHAKPNVSGKVVYFTVKKNTAVSICGVAISSTQQLVYFELLDKDKKKLADTYEVKGGKFQGENEILEIPEGEGPKTVTYGPLDIETMLEVKFDHGRDDNTSVGGVIQAKMKEMTDDNGTTRVDMIPYHNGGFKCNRLPCHCRALGQMIVGSVPYRYLTRTPIPHRIKIE